MTTTVQTGTGKFEKILERCQDLEPVPTSVAYPCDETSLAGAIDAAAQGLITPILVGPAATIRELARAKGIDLGGAAIEDVPDSRSAAARAVALVREGKAELVMKGSLHSDEILAAVIVLREGHDTGAEALRAFCKAALAAYKVPQEFCLMRRDELPVTDTGKVQKVRLAAMLAAKRAG